LDAQQENNLLSNPTQYINLVAGIDQVFLRITTEFDCFQIIKLDLIVFNNPDSSNVNAKIASFMSKIYLNMGF
jgi:hypothetical protein